MKSGAGRIAILLVLCSWWASCASAQHNPEVVLETNFGDIVVELFADEAPVTVDNFLGYVRSGFYDGLLFHRVIYGFMIQGGGFYLEGNYIMYTDPCEPIINESYNGLSNVRGTIAMARTSDPNSATSQFYINHADNLFLDRDQAVDGFGYCVFGAVIEGMDVVDAIAQTPTYYVSASFANFPYNPTVDIYRASVRPCVYADCGDISEDGVIDREDLAAMASAWLGEDCNSANQFCGGNDLDYSGNVDFFDFALFGKYSSAPPE
ncbi:MAG: peptidylprolyl isomerase [Sedimentisphaerales bacterium]|nr:peptidylprolyl isomerase [Sedimentisphaerales bacterium]